MKKKNIIRGKKARASGSRFELKVRKDMESNGWIVDRWTNNVEFHNDKDVNEFPFTTGKLISAKPKTLFINGKRIIINMWTGFPDFVAYVFELNKNIKHLNEELIETKKLYEVIGVESKSLGYLDKEEKEKAKWYLENNIFSKILIASKSKERGKITYKEFI